MTGTWTDSYPYNANSTFALHPQFIHLPDAGVKADRKYKALQKELNALPAVDYERVNGEKLRLLREAFSAGGQEVISSKEYQRFYSANKGWLIPYAAFRVLRDQNGTPEFEKWKTLSEYSETKVKSFCSRHKAETDFYCYLQFCLDAQLKDAVEYAHSKGIAIKGDLPIGISRTSVDAWQYPRLFNLDSQAGAPPDAFSADGQNWGLPTYNWDEMAKDGYAWWKSRLGKMSEYFDAFRIDHILGFFRIWEIPAGVKSGLLGHFNPALPYSADELRGRGFNPDSQLFVPDPHREGWYHPRIAAQNTEDYRTLNGYMKDAYNNLYNDFFYHRHNGFWKDCAMRKLPALLDSTRMLACGEDLGMIPACVPEVMRELRILSLEIQRMPKSPERHLMIRRPTRTCPSAPQAPTTHPPCEAGGRRTGRCPSVSSTRLSTARVRLHISATRGCVKELSASTLTRLRCCASFLSRTGFPSMEPSASKATPRKSGSTSPRTRATTGAGECTCRWKTSWPIQT